MHTSTLCLLACIIVFVLSAVEATAQSTSAEARINPDLLTKQWSAKWITVPGISPFEYGVYHFRRSFYLPQKPSTFVVHVTADNRYQLFVNGERVVSGPARGDLYHWQYETVDLAPYLLTGKNVLAAVVWNFAQLAPIAQVSDQTGFLLQGNKDASRVIDTGASWLCLKDDAYRALPVTHQEMRGYFVAGPGERIDGSLYPWNWETRDLTTLNGTRHKSLVRDHHATPEMVLIAGCLSRAPFR